MKNRSPMVDLQSFRIQRTNIDIFTQQPKFHFQFSNQNFPRRNGHRRHHLRKQMDPKEEESSLIQPLLQEQQHDEEQQHDQEQQHKQEQHEQQQIQLLEQQQQLLKQQLEQLTVEGERQKLLHPRVHDVLLTVEQLHKHMQIQHELLLQQQANIEPNFRVHFYYITSMFLGLVLALYVALMGILVARDLFDGQWAIVLASTVLLCYSALISYGLLGYYYRVRQDPEVDNRYVRIVRVSSYLTAVVALILLFVAIFS
ncbi:hypothetical protein QVD17_38416 [Tagetes erecta]|uniref:Uncharacterized protein n=1 Tax=Tagetes erecta TaxID=13708 RepID=A0AAD8JN61_TARER|nr:hypothetical protein QVD17_38416 [Tagetes erecta]